jgi:glutamate racemase
VIVSVQIFEDHLIESGILISGALSPYPATTRLLVIHKLPAFVSTGDVLALGCTHHCVTKEAIQDAVVTF